MLTWTVKFQSCCVIIRKSVYSPVTNLLKIQTMTLIANPIYDSVFKYMMEDDRVAKILLSALLQKDIIDLQMKPLQMKPHEYTEMMQTRISMLRIDFAATVRNQDGSTQLILIELQKTWLTTETLRFRQYLGTQYLDKKNVLPKDVNPNGYGIPIVSISWAIWKSRSSM